MGAAASVHGHDAELTLEQAKTLAGGFWDQAQWDKHSVDGVLHRDKFKDIIQGADPEFIWSLYDKDGSGSIQVAELSRLLIDLNLGEGDADLDTAMAEMELSELDDNMDDKLDKKEFMKWLEAKKAELRDMEGGGAAEPEPAKTAVTHKVSDDNAWGSDPAHHKAATRIQAAHRGRQHRKKLQGTESSDVVSFEVLDVGKEDIDRAARKIQAHARGKLARKSQHGVHQPNAVAEDLGTEV